MATSTTNTLRTQVLVVGSGAGGLAAAIAAGRNGADTLLVENAGFLGGISATLPWLGFHDRDYRPIIKGLPLEFCRHLQAAGADSSVGGATGRAPQDGPDPGEQLAEAERLDHVIVRTELEPDDAVDLLALRGDDDDRDVRARAQLPAHLGAVDVGEAEVEQHEIGRVRGQRVRARRHPRDRESLAA